MEIDKEIVKKISQKSSGDSTVRKAVDDQDTSYVHVPVIRKSKIDNLGRSYGTGGRKSAKARVWIKPGKGEIIINNKKVDEYFSRDILNMIINTPFEVTDSIAMFDVFATVKGSGLSGQAGAVRHGIAIALSNYSPESYHKKLRVAGLLTRDSRRVERKKYGFRKARKKRQFSKR